MSKYQTLLIAVALVALMFSGCTSSTPATVAPTPTVNPAPFATSTYTSAPTAQDPIIGVWRISDSDVYDDRFHFYPDGTYKESFYSTTIKWGTTYRETTVFSGTWSAQNGNSYRLLSETTGDPRTFMYIQAKNTIYDTENPRTLLTRYQGDVAAASSAPVSTPITTYISSSTPLTTLSGSSDDVVSFTATGTGLRIFTMRYSGTSNFAVILKDGNGGYMTLLANEIGSYSGKKSEQLSTGKYYLDVTASGPWSIQISS